MTNDQNREAFIDRIQRIEAREREKSSIKEEMKQRSAKRGGRSRSVGTPRSRMLVLWMATMGALVYLIPWLMDRYPEKFVFETGFIDDIMEVASRIAPNTAADDDALFPSIEKTERLRHREYNDFGIVMRTPLVHWTGDANLDITSLTSGYIPIDDADIPASLDIIERNTSCRTRPPRKGERLMSVNIERPQIPSSIQVISTKAATGATRPPVAMDLAADADATHLGQLARIDVVVTETSAPVYLVLQTFGSALWHLHTAKGVDIAHIVLIGEGGAAVSLPDPATGVEALRISDFLETSADTCPVAPWRRPNAGWTAQSKAAKGDPAMNNAVQQYARGHRGYDGWFSRNFGVDTNSYSLNALSATHVLLGRVPETPVPFRPLSEARVKVTADDMVFAEPPDARAGRTRAAIADLQARTQAAAR